MVSIVIYKLITFCFIALNILILLKLFPNEGKPKRKPGSKKV